MLDFFRELAVLIAAAECLGLLARRFHVPQVLGQIAAGLLVGPCLLGWVQANDTINVFAEMGVILLMFGTGLETDLKHLIKAGPKSFLIACMGVAVPLVCGWALFGAFFGFGSPGSEEFRKALFMGTILTATSVSITVAVLQELGKLSSFLGTTIVGAAVIDDVIGMIVLTCVTGSGSLGNVLIKTMLFFGFAVGVGYLIYLGARKLDALHPRTHRLSILSVAFCFAMAYISEQYFGIADITGAYAAGLILCSIQDSHYIQTKVDTSNYLFFGPLFFASIGLKTDVSQMTLPVLWFSLCLIPVALLAKIIGCGAAAKLCRFSSRDALKAGIGMMTRGEVALIVAQKGLSTGGMDPVFFPSIIALILVSSVLTPLLLARCYAGDPKEEAALPR